MTEAIHASVNGRIEPAHSSFLPVLDRGFLFGDAVFEVMRTYNGHPHALEAHLNRLFDSAHKVGMTPDFDASVLREEIHALLDQHAMQEDRSLRIVITRGTGPLLLSTETNTTCNRIVLMMPIRKPPEHMYSHGVGVSLVQAQDYGAATSIAGVKSANYLGNILACAHAQKRGDHEAVFLAQDGMILEGSTSNVFLVIGNVLLTPPLATGILPGITRQIVCDIAASCGRTVRESALYPRDLYGCEEAFLCSSVREILPIVRVDGLVIATGKPGAITKQMHQAYTDYTHRVACGTSA